MKLNGMEPKQNSSRIQERKIAAPPRQNIGVFVSKEWVTPAKLPSCVPCVKFSSCVRLFLIAYELASKEKWGVVHQKSERVCQQRMKSVF